MRSTLMPPHLTSDSRSSWLRQVAAATRDRRLARADSHDSKARLARLERRLSLAQWHEGRARGQIETLERIEACQTDTWAYHCPECGVVAMEKLSRCDNWRYCLSCRGARCRVLRARLQAAVDYQRKVWAPELRRKRGAYSERMVTLTVPHSGDAATDFAMLQASWRIASRAYRSWMRKRHHMPKDAMLALPFARTLEITGSDAGHAHCHAWMLGPYLPHVILRSIWGRSLRIGRIVDPGDGRDGVYVPVRSVAEVVAELRASMSGAVLERELADIARASRYNRRALSYLPWPVVDVRRSDGDVGNEIIKYLTVDKSISAEGELGGMVEPAVYADLLEATIGRRLICVSRGLWIAFPKATCRDCEHTYRPLRAVSRDHAARPPARAPPGAAFVHTLGISV